MAAERHPDDWDCYCALCGGLADSLSFPLDNSTVLGITYGLGQARLLGESDHVENEDSPWG
jgi:hypothetical protein